ncbi:MAG: hypothetical protein COC24_002220 [Alphaproteobacteria bacterium]|nr:hypothetical protein [Alphaproteobacteria bacterium]
MSQNNENLIIAVDGGGSTCRVTICRLDGTILSQAVGGAANLTTHFETAVATIESTVKMAYKTANLSADRTGDDFIYLGLAGAKLDGLATRLKGALKFKDIEVTTDQQITIQGAMSDEDGAIASLGTGSFFVCRQQGKTLHVGGWGMHLGDECSGAYLGRALLRKSLHAYDGLIDHSPLSQNIMQHFGGSPQEMILFARSASPMDYGSFAPQLIAAFEHGDAIAQQIMNDSLAILHNMLDVLEVKATGSLYMLGGLGAIYQKLLRPEYQQICCSPKADAMAGAIILARKKWRKKEEN